MMKRAERALLLRMAKVLVHVFLVNVYRDAEQLGAPPDELGGDPFQRPIWRRQEKRRLYHYIKKIANAYWKDCLKDARRMEGLIARVEKIQADASTA